MYNFCLFQSRLCTVTVQLFAVNFLNCRMFVGSSVVSRHGAYCAPKCSTISNADPVPQIYDERRTCATKGISFIWIWRQKCNALWFHLTLLSLKLCVLSRQRLGWCERNRLSTTAASSWRPGLCANIFIRMATGLRDLTHDESATYRDCQRHGNCPWNLLLFNA